MSDPIDKLAIHFVPFTHRFVAGESTTVQLDVRADECINVETVRASMVVARDVFVIHDIRVDNTSILPSQIDAFFLCPRAAHYLENRRLHEPYPIHSNQKLSMIVEYTGKAVDPQWLDNTGHLPFGFMLEGRRIENHAPHDVVDEQFRRSLELIVRPLREQRGDHTVAIGYLLSAALELTIRQGNTVDDMIKSLQQLPTRFPRSN